jgi:hypothetical protein
VELKIALAVLFVVQSWVELLLAPLLFYCVI